MIKVDKYVKGLKVVRGPDWDWGNQDGGAGNVGEILELSNSIYKDRVVVQWQNGHKNGYAIGHDGKYDLALANEADAHLLGHSIPAEPTLESLKAMFPVCTEFIPVNKDDGKYSKSFKVLKSWKLFEDAIGYYFKNSRNESAHYGYLYLNSGKLAEIVTTPEISTSPEFKVGDKVIITQGDCLYMNQYIGKVATITKVLSNGDVNIDIDKGAWYWVYASGHFIPYKEEHVPYKVGDTLTAKDGSTFKVGSVKWDETESITGKEITNGKTWLYESESRGWFTHNFITMVWSKEQPVIEETPLEKAKRMYPPGTRFKSIMYNSGNFIVADLVYTVESDWEINEDDDGDIDFCNVDGEPLHQGYVYRQSPDKLEHRWAEILPIMSEESPFITEAKRRYPVGTKFRPPHMLDEEWYEDHYCIVTEDTVFELREDSKVVTACIPSRYPTWVEEDTPETPSKYGNTNLFRHVYFETYGWAPIYEEPVKHSLLKENDTVIFDGPNGPRKYTVSWTCLSFKGRDNDIIFQDLGVDKYQLASKMYGYSVHTGDWPSFNSKDYKAATNLVNELHRLCAEAKSSVQQTTNNNLNNNSNGKFSKTNSDIIEVPRLNQQVRLHVESGSFGFEGSESKSTVTSNHRNIKAQVSRERGSFDESYVCRSVLVGRRNPSI